MPLPPHVASVREVRLGTRGPAPARAERAAAVTAARLLFRGLLGDGDASARLFADGLHRLAALATPPGTAPVTALVLPGAASVPTHPAPSVPASARPGRRPLQGVPTAGALLDAVRAARGLDVSLPRLTLRQARHAAGLLERALRPLSVAAPDADLTHAASSGPPLLCALAALWRAGTPYLLTEHDSHLRRQYLVPGDDDPVRTVLLRFHRALSRLGYESAGRVTTSGRFHRRWQLRHGADPERVLVVPPGLDDPGPAGPEPDAPLLLWRGTIGPDAELPCLLSAFSLVRARVPGVRLVVDGPVADAGYARACRDLGDRLGLGGTLRFTDDPGADGQIVVATAVTDGTPYPLIRSLMAGRPAVATDAGTAAETVGDGGIVVPAGEPDALADACTLLLTDSDLRGRLGLAARRRTLARHAPHAALTAYDHLYRDLRCR